MEPVAIIFHNIQIYWSHIIAVLTAAVWFFSVLAFASAAKIRTGAVVLLPALAGALSFVLSRLLYWYTAAESYADIKDSEAPTALQNATDLNLRDMVEELNQSQNQDGMKFDMKCTEATSKCTLTYYFDAHFYSRRQS